MLRLLVYDRTVPRLRHAWQLGSHLYHGLGRIDAAFGATSWEEGLGWLAQSREPIAEIQYWGHGHWGRVLVASDALDASALHAGHRHQRALRAIRERLTTDALVWFRTCEAFGANAGRDFAMRWADWLGASVAGHTYVIGALQSGLHGLRPGHSPDWAADEGLAEGTPAAPMRARWSAPGCPRTITCFERSVPTAWFA